jgi:hypothetical protein
MSKTAAARTKHYSQRGYWYAGHPDVTSFVLWEEDAFYADVAMAYDITKKQVMLVAMEIGRREGTLRTKPWLMVSL